MLILFDNGQIYLKLEQQYALFSSSNFTQALDTLFKCFTVLNVQYPSEATNIYKFIEIIYGVNFGEKVPSLLVELDNKILNLV
jgi:hypothetical protein